MAPRPQVRLSCPDDGEFTVPVGEVVLGLHDVEATPVVLAACTGCGRPLSLGIKDEVFDRLRTAGAQDCTSPDTRQQLVAWLDMVAGLVSFRAALDAPDAAARFAA